MKKLIILIAALLFLVACSTSPESKPEEKPDDKETTETTPNESDKLVSLEEMYDIYTESYPEISVTEIEFKQKNSKVVYEFEGVLDHKEYEITYDAYTKEVIKEDIDDASPAKRQIEKDDLKNIAAILKETKQDVPDGYSLSQWKLERESDMLEFEIEYINDEEHKIEYKYNADTKELIKKDD